MADLEKKIDAYLRRMGQVPARAPGQYESQKRKLLCSWCGKEHGNGYVAISCPVGPRHNACVMPHNIDTRGNVTCQHREHRGGAVCGERVKLYGRILT